MAEKYNLFTTESMKLFYDSLNERDRRRYAAIEAIKFGKDGIKYISKILSIDPKTIKSGVKELKKKN